MWKQVLNNRLFSVATVRVIIITVSLSGIAVGCTNVAESKSAAGDNNKQRNSSSSLDKAYAQTFAQKTEQNLEQTSNISQSNRKLSRRTVDANIREGISYQKARKVLLRQGWKPHLQGDAPNLNNLTVKELYEYGYVEIKDCSGTGVGVCLFEFINADGDILFVSARVLSADNKERVIWRWSIQRKANQNQHNSSTAQYSQKLPFIGKRFFNFAGGNGTGQSILISADGTTTVQLHGKFENLVLYQGKYTNPIKLQDASGKSLLLKDGKIYLLNEDGQFSRYCQGEDKPCVSDLLESTSENQQPVQTTNIKNGYYITGIGLGIDPRIGLEVQGNQYRYYDEYENKEWRDIHELKLIKPGIVFDGNQYWCNPPNRDDGVCTKNGWER